MHKHRLHAGGVFGGILLASIAIDLVFSVWLKSNIFKIASLRANGVVLAGSVCIGAVLLVLGSVVGHMSHDAFNRAVDYTGRVKYIIREGPFRWVRHPFYLSLILILLAFILLLNSYILLVGSILLAVFLVSESHREEAILVGEFGETYLSYQRETGMFLPKLSRT